MPASYDRTEEEEVGRIGASADRAGALRAEPPAASQAKPLIPCAGAWTPGPWEAVYLPGSRCHRIRTADDRSIAYTRQWRDDREDAPNAALIAAAPDLYAALEGLLDAIEAVEEQGGQIIDPHAELDAGAALSKARGDQ